MATDETVKIVVILLLALLVLPVLSMGFMAPMMGFMGGSHWGMPAGGVGLLGIFWLIPLAFLLLLGWGVFRLLGGTQTRDPAIQELREAYARGELSDEEFEERLQRLERE
ncbi:MAG: SHOCT domain-containing protein [Halodesulfurarchaeum sp.]